MNKKACRVHVSDNSDHTFTRSDRRAALEAILSDELFSLNKWGPRRKRPESNRSKVVDDGRDTGLSP